MRVSKNRPRNISTNTQVGKQTRYPHRKKKETQFLTSYHTQKLMWYEYIDQNIMRNPQLLEDIGDYLHDLKGEKIFKSQKPWP